MRVRWHPFSHVVSRWRLHTHLHCGLIASICPGIRPRMISNIVLQCFAFSCRKESFYSKTNVEPKLEPTMIRIRITSITTSSLKIKPSTSTKLLQSRPARPSGRPQKKTVSGFFIIPSHSSVANMCQKHGFGDMLKKSVTQILDSHIIQVSNRWHHFQSRRPPTFSHSLYLNHEPKLDPYFWRPKNQDNHQTKMINVYGFEAKSCFVGSTLLIYRS